MNIEQGLTIFDFRSNARMNKFDASASLSTSLEEMKIVLKKLRETFVCLKIIERTGLYKSKQEIAKAKLENTCTELVEVTN